VAEWDLADVLARCKRLAFRPGVDPQMGDPDWYAFISEAQEYWVSMLASHVPESQYGPPELMATADGGFTYYFSAIPPNNKYPLGHAELRFSKTGRLLRPGAEFDPACEYVPEGDHIRFPGQKSKSFPDGAPYARYVKIPAAIAGAGDAANLVLKPDPARMLIVFRAAIIWATRGGYRDPAPFEKLERKAWAGDPELPGDIGWMGALKMQFLFAGAAAWPAGSSVDNWWRSIDDGSGYQAQVP
jgi:hypothetical protein